MDILTKIRIGLSYRIKQAGYQSYEKFSHEHELSKGALSLILNGKREPRLSTLIKLSEALEIPFVDLFDLPSGAELNFTKPLGSRLKNLS